MTFFLNMDVYMQKQDARLTVKTFFLNPHIYLLLLLPLLCISVLKIWPSFDMNGYIDPWFYLGYFLDLKTHLQTFPNTYYGSRLPWLLSGHFIYSFLKPITAFYVLSLIFYYLGVFALYFILKKTVGNRAALFTAILLGCYYYFMCEMGSHYSPGSCITFMFLALWMLTDQDENPTSFFLAGVFLGCTIYTNLFLIHFFPVLMIYYFLLPKKNKVLKNFFCLTMGFLAITLFLSVFNYFENQRFFFFWPSIKFGKGFATHGLNQETILEWLPKSPWLLLPAIINVLAVIYIIAQRHYIRTVGYMFQINLIVASCILIFWQWMGHTILNLHYYACFIIPFTFLALGAQVALLLKNLSSSQYYITLLVILILSIATYVLITPWTAFMIIMGLGILLQLFFRKQLVNGTLLLFISFIFFYINLGYLSSTHSRWQTLANQKNIFSSYLLIHRAFAETKKMDPNISTYFWYNQYESLGYIFKSLSSTYLSWHRLYNDAFPNTTPVRGEKYQVHDHIKLFILSSDKSALTKANQSLQRFHLHAKLLAEKNMQEKDLQFKIFYVELL